MGGVKMADIKFGTDGWRAIISDDFTFANVGIVSQAISSFILDQKEPVYKKREVVIGYDTRFMSDKYAEIIAKNMAANGIKAILSVAACPTPSVSYYIKKYKLTGGVMITASHNPAEYNGVKYKGFFGGSAGPDIIKDIEARLHKNNVKTLDFEEALKKGLIVKKDLVTDQLDFIKKYADMAKLKKAKLKVLVDSMNGSGGTYLGDLLKGTSIKVDYMNTELNPSFNGKSPEPNGKYLKELMIRVKNGGYDIGVATDGDADRVGIVDEKGRVLSGHKVMSLLLLHLLINKKMTGGVVQTVCGTRLIDKISTEYGIKAYETPVGFKYLCELMIKEDILLAGEETGGIGFKNYIPERDGFLSALLIMEMMITMKKSLSEILKWVDSKFGKYVYQREDMSFPEKSRDNIVSGLEKKPLEKILNKKVVSLNKADGIKFICEDESWLLLRMSGTEPKLRIYAETSSEKLAGEYIEFGRKYALSLM
ncbi:phosphoglucosamine mutase [Candidatus Omnitrophus magneticus]|uniref:Phosphoglucosamine mutase n=1 Tax=Candidatus Omnitrophus magneticus TaxID=1609969 RepID=A0A0F0CSK1_9BACT|nr:phosphoglucosamine mutase [Candidatus Omnitrophus magneticus]